MKKTWLLKVSLIYLCVCISMFLFTTYLQASVIQLEFNDIDYDEAQYIKFIIDSDKNFRIDLYMKDNDNNPFRVRYQTEHNEDTGDYKDDNDDELAIFLYKDEYVTGHKETFNSFTHSNSLSLDEYINTHWKKHDYNGGSAKLEKIWIYGDEFKLYYIAIDEGDFADPTWEIDVSEKNWDSLTDFENDGHSIPDSDEYSTTIAQLHFLGDCIRVTMEFIPRTGNSYYDYLPSIYWNQPYFGGYQQPYTPYRYQQSYNPYEYQQQAYSYGWNQPSYGWDGYDIYGWNQPSYGWNQPSYGWDAYNYGYDMYGWNNYPYGYGGNRPYLSGYSYWNFPLLTQPFDQGYVNYIDSYGRGYTPGMVLNSDGKGNYIWTPPGVFID